MNGSPRQAGLRPWRVLRRGHPGIASGSGLIGLVLALGVSLPGRVQAQPLVPPPSPRPASAAASAPAWGASLAAPVSRPARVLPPLAQVTDLASLAHTADQWVRRGQDEPQAVLRPLAQAMARAPDGVAEADWQRVLARSRGLVAARSGLLDEVDRAVADLNRAAVADAPSLARADAALVRAVSEDHQGRASGAADAARAADADYSAICGQVTPAAAACDHRMRWRAVHLLALRAESQGNRVEAVALAQRAFELAAAAGDHLPQAMSAAALASLHQALGDSARASRQLALAERVARRHGDDEALVRVRLAESRVAQMREDLPNARRALEDALKRARTLESPRLAALIIVNLSDIWLREGRSAQALAAIEQALPVMRRHRDLRNQPVLLHNRGLARVNLGQIAPGRADLEAALALWKQMGSQGEIEGALRESADTLAKVGDLRGALELYHRERDLRDELTRGDREALLAQLRTRYRSEAEQHELKLLERDNALKAARLDNQRLQQRIWAAAVGLLLAAMLVLAVLVKRTRDANLRLRRSQALLKVQSERDALTGLANRRHLRELLTAQALADGFQGGLLMLDVDHFKRVNDEQGHSVGDQVLIEVARRLGSAVRADDLVCRWGGEEFLVHAPGLSGEALDALAQRLLAAVGDTPITVAGGASLSVTASVGQGGFPLPGQTHPVSWETAVNLVDMALYTAKGHGRDCAVGLQSLRGGDLSAVAEDFEQARVSGQLNLRVLSRQPSA